MGAQNIGIRADDSWNWLSVASCLRYPTCYIIPALICLKCYEEKMLFGLSLQNLQTLSIREGSSKLENSSFVQRVRP
jgi:hypothetical protein